MRLILLGLILLLVGATQTAIADTVVRTGDSVSITNEQNVGGNFYAIGNSVVVSGDSSEDLTMIGGRVRTDGAVSGDVLVVGITTEIAGTVAGDVRVVSGEVTVSGSISGDLVVLGGSVELLSNAYVGGDILMYVGRVLVDGVVIGDVLGRMEVLQVNGQIDGDIDVTVNSLQLGDRATIGSDVTYTSAELLVQALNSSIAGTIIRNDPVSVTEITSIARFVWLLATLLVAVMVWYFLSRQTLVRTVNRTATHTARAMIVGVIALLAIPLAIIVCTISYVGVLLAATLLFGLLACLLLALVAAPALIGWYMARVLQQASTVSPVTLGLGSLVLTLLLLVPYVGIILVSLMVIAILGSLIELLVRGNRV